MPANPEPSYSCPQCPLCGGEPMFRTPTLVPWFCMDDRCDVFGWDPYSTLEENLMDAAPVRWFIDGVEQPPTGP
jgi:hypothetical protein